MGKKIPERMCIGCNMPHTKREMIRIVRSPEGEFSIDLTGKKSGRGAYICRNKDCFAAAKKKHSLERSFRSKVPQRVYDDLLEELYTQGDIE